MTIMFRIPLMAAAIVLGIAVYADPYTFSADTGHFRVGAPLWQTAVALADLSLLGLYTAALWKRETRRAIGFLAVGTMLNIIANIIFITRDGVDRFLMAFGTYEILTLYLGTLAIRVAMLSVLGFFNDAAKSSAR
ncbi:hypothetical protein [Longimicrobium sp.]|uniref:hypothetical protein n=1 Tax=Longimicrobium sp. TaxID=2029185 RepID=UPI003B3A91B2